MLRADFLAWEAEQTEKHEFWRGEVFARIGARQVHVLRSIDIFRRTETDDWLLATHDGARGLVLASLEFSASLTEVFEDVPVPDAEDHAGA